MQDLTSAQTADAMLSARRRAWMAEAEEFELAAHFADLHPGEAVEQQQQPDGSTRLDVIVEQMEARMARSISQGSGLAPTLERRYGLNPAAGAMR